MQTVKIGCSAFDNAAWEGVFYPPGMDRKNYFAYYCEHFDTLEINSTFYKFPSVRSLQKWHRESPSDFTFSVKAPKLITHEMRFENCTELLAKFYDACSHGLAEKLGCILFQFPGSFTYERSRIELIMNSLDHRFQNVVEFRNNSWWNDEAFRIVQQTSASLCAVSYPGLPEDFPPARIRYVRLHGTPKLFYSSYDIEYLKNLRSKLASENNSYVYFNNTASVAGIVDAMLFSELAG